ncbi:transposase [Sporosarcina siberiensis]|uniref:Transposase n=1 Tax=Sporosarcina siberiensis TaxID=1365606 RepID=A0ABW4SIB9_9BACL
MARKNRIWNPRYFDHVIMRGNNRQDIFRTKADFDEFFRVLHYAYMKYPFQIVAYCIMTNHYHLLIRSPEVPLGKIMALINRRYSDYFNKRYSYSGYLYGGRYFAKVAASTHSLLEVSRYIHQNPIETKIPMVSKMEEYPYSSFALYHSKKPSPYAFLDLELLPSHLPPPYSKCNKGYHIFCNEKKDAAIHVTSLD